MKFPRRAVSTALSTMMKDGFDVKALRAFRVLRPLRLVSGVPSKLFATIPSISPFRGRGVTDYKCGKLVQCIVSWPSFRHPSIPPSGLVCLVRKKHHVFLSLTAKGKKLVRAGVLMRFSSRSLRFASGIEFHFTSHGSAPPHRPSRHLCHHHLRHHWLGTLFRQIAHDLLRPRNGCVVRHFFPQFIALIHVILFLKKKKK